MPGLPPPRHFPTLPWRTFIAFELAPISAVLTAEHVVRRIAAHRAHVDEPGALGIRPEPPAAIGWDVLWLCDPEEPATLGSSPPTFKASGDRTIVTSIFELRRPPAANRGKALLYLKRSRRPHGHRRQTPPRCSGRAPSNRPGQGYGRRRTRQSAGGRAPRLVGRRAPPGCSKPRQRGFRASSGPVLLVAASGCTGATGAATARVTGSSSAPRRPGPSHSGKSRRSRWECSARSLASGREQSSARSKPRP
jgi:hypothetical protein